MKPTRPPIPNRDGPRYSEAIEHALDAVSLMAESGHVALPVKPTPAMLEAGARAGGVTVVMVWKIYRAMIEAA